MEKESDKPAGGDTPTVMVKTPEKESDVGPGDSSIVGVILNSLEISFDLPIEITHGHVLRRANDAEVVRIKEELRHFAGSYSPEIVMESIWDPEKGFLSKIGDKSKWRYYVIEVKEAKIVNGIRTSNLGLRDLERNSCLTSLPISCPLILYPSGGSSCGGFNESDAMLAFKRSFMTGPQLFSESVLEQIKSISEMIDGASQPIFAPYHRAHDSYYRLRGYSTSQPLYPLGLFSIIESVLTHPPKSTDHTDSLTKQICSKMNLLNKRFSSSIDISQFTSLDFVGVWKKLYAFRSCLAHGTLPNFSGDLQALKTRDEAQEFLENATKQVLIQCFKEPALLTDLKDC